ncbi:hypothetical protein WJX81_002999 [Elliptochloris bilobata]|uniref:Complex 1 LYR protein domain-containing protein n=1 Tax=Elliptochloris bilobata TaxID=381761 RepID=A0AAW1SBF8_9CHLO
MCFPGAGAKFPNYNIREYVKRKAREDFRAHASEADPAAAQALWAQAKDELKVWTRQATVYSLYARPQKSVMDIPLKAALDAQAASPLPQTTK